MNGVPSLVASGSVSRVPVRAAISSYIVDHPEFRSTGEAMMSIWEEGGNSLKN